MTDNDPLVEQLSRVQSDLGFRKWTRRRILLVAVLVLVDLLVSVLSVLALAEAYHQADARARDQQEARRGSCVQFNVDQQNKREAITGGIVEALRKLITTPEGSAFVDELEPVLRESVTSKLPYRDCSPAGIEAFLKKPPSDPATGG